MDPGVLSNKNIFEFFDARRNRLLLTAVQVARGAFNCIYEVHLGKRKGLTVLTVEKNSEGSIWSAVDYSFKQIYGSGIEVAALTYQGNMMRIKGPRKMAVACPAFDKQGDPFVWFKPQSGKSGSSGLLRCLTHGPNQKQRPKIMMLTNRAPLWNAEMGTWMLDFGKRVKKASVKNFQLVKLSRRNR